MLFGDFGNSWRLNRDRPVTDLLLSRLPKTVQLMGISSLLALLLGVPLGVYSAVKQYSRFDYIFTTLAFMGTAMPTFFFGILMILIFSLIPYRLGWFYLPPGSVRSRARLHRSRDWGMSRPARCLTASCTWCCRSPC